MQMLNIDHDTLHMFLEVYQEDSMKGNIKTLQIIYTDILSRNKEDNYVYKEYLETPILGMHWISDFQV